MNEEFYCENSIKSLFMVCGRDFNKKIIELRGKNGEILLEYLVGVKAESLG